jgi:integrase/recombinase XerD
MLLETEALITAESVKQAYLGIHASQKGHTLKELTEYYKKIWEDKLKEGGFKNYKTTIDYVNRFLESKDPVKGVYKYPAKNVYLSQVNSEFLTEFEYYIRHNPVKAHDPCLGNGVGKHIQRFKRIMNWAKEELKWIKQNTVEDYSCPLKKNKRKKLSFEQLVVLEQKTFQDPDLNYVKDLFLFSCYTGFAFADVMTIAESHFDWDVDGTIWCKIYRMKSDVLSPVPLIKDAAKIINKYKGQFGNTIFKRVTNQFVNRCLKIIQEVCGIEFPLTFHIARHTFAKTVALKNGIPLETVQLIMGHTKITTTQIYAEVDEEKILDDMTGIEEKLETKRAIIKDRLRQKMNVPAPTTA